MDRRVVSGLVSLAIVASGRVGPARAGDLAPALPPLPGEVAAPPPATIPPSPLSSPPVGMMTIPSIGETINGGLTPGYAPASRGTTAGPSRAPAPRRTSTTAIKADPAAVPSTLVDGADLLPAPPPSTTPPIPAGRPAPFASQVPTMPRLQAAPVAIPAGGRLAPHSGAIPSGPRPQAPAARPATAEPVSDAPPSLDPVTPRAETLPGLPTVAQSAPAPAPAANIDTSVMPSSIADATALRSTAKAKSAPVASRRAAAVGDEVITMHELELAVNETVSKYGQGQKPDRATLNQIAARVLDTLIEESLIVQEAKRKMGNSVKSQTMFNDYAERKFREEELTPLLRKSAASNEYELSNKLLAETGRSVNDMREAFKKRLTAREFLWNEIRTKVSADVSEMRIFYNEHLEKFDRPAQVTWREIEIDASKAPNRAAARQQAEAALDRLRRGEEFEQVARTASHGATANKGGFWETTPGGFGDPAVNTALDQMPIGQVSQIIEGPTSFRIVRVETRRDAGPARFDEVQEQIRNAVFEGNFDKAKNDYIRKLRRRNLVVTIFDQTESAPSLSGGDDPSVRTASGR